MTSVAISTVGRPVVDTPSGRPAYVSDVGAPVVVVESGGAPLALLNPDGTPWSATPQSMEFIGWGSAAAATLTIGGVQAGDWLVGVANRNGSGTVPTFDNTVGWGRIDGTADSIGGDGDAASAWVGATSMCAIAFAKIAESDTPAFGTHTNAGRVFVFAYRFAKPIANPIGASRYLWASGSNTTAPWAGLTLAKPNVSHVVTLMQRQGDELIVARPTDYANLGDAGISVRYRWGRSDGPVSAWPQRDVTQTVSGFEASIAIEIGF